VRIVLDKEDFKKLVNGEVVAQSAKDEHNHWHNVEIILADIGVEVMLTEVAASGLPVDFAGEFREKMGQVDVFDD
jgi:hypothetical protein